ncbi:MAG: FAD-binding oxidoreductase [Sandaracinaceae bacterium]|nr:FAD-binding oxidoreductase [Sandaracinaceae bacterium]
MTLRAQPMLTGWGRLPAPGTEVIGEHLETITRGAVLSRGLGRSYGDSSLPAIASDRVAGTRLANRILAFNGETGVYRAEAGISLLDLNRVFMPQGWFTPVTPGTKFVTLGGMVASDVHGKNHHVAGCFGEHVRALRICLADNNIVECSAEQYPDLFYATIGGMGLLGHILEVEVAMHRISSPWIWQESERVPNIQEYLASLERGARAFPMTSGWIDCLNRGRSMGRGILFAGRWASKDEAPSEPPPEKKPLTFPFNLPNWALNNFTGQMFNRLVYYKHASKTAKGVIHPDGFFYPLDVILEWNRGYGTRGFTQYQCVLPRAAGPKAVLEFMDRLTKLGGASPLCVIKDCGPEGKGLLSFPLEGTSIAIDMAISPSIQRIVDSLNEFVIAAGGRIYLTKDRFTRADHFRAMEPRLDKFLAARAKWDPKRRLRSAQSVRILGDKE